MLSRVIDDINNITEKLLKNWFISRLPSSNRYKRLIAFTLAEVLIVLLIVGIVASLVIPAIIRDTQDAEFKVAYKKAYAIISNVTKQALSESNFMSKQTKFESITSKGNFKILESYFSVTKDCSNNNNDQCWDSTGEVMAAGNNFSQPSQAEYAFIDNSGMSWALYSNSENIIVVDTNGFKNPNRYGKDRWQLTFADTNNIRINSGLPSKVIPFNADITFTSGYCHYPPCYFRSWLLQ